MKKADYANLNNIEYIEQLYSKWQNQPQSIDADWQLFFQGFELGRAGTSSTSAIPPKDLKEITAVAVPRATSTPEAAAQSQWQIDRLLTSYRELGHLIADLNPLSNASEKHPDLALSRFGFTESDLDREYAMVNMEGPKRVKLREIIDTLRATYCRTVGVEFMHIQDVAQRRWLQSRLESTQCQLKLTPEKRLRILRKLFEADLFENFVHSKFLGQKRFSLEGAEAMIPALDEVRELAPELGVKEIVIGMPHRGRLTVLANIVEKRLEEIFDQFEDNYSPEMVGAGSGDVKYHMGASCDYVSSRGKSLHISLSPNPSHLEAVDPIALGRARGKQRRYNVDRKVVLPLLIHGDAALAGQGLVMECLQLSQLEGYTTGGTFHLVVNNQLGFTTDPKDGRSTRYCTDIAKMMDSPVFHVNAHDPEALLFCVGLCLEFRQQFGVDTFIDLIGYRKYGHNETDEPSYTQPQMYDKISKIRNVRELYTTKLIADGVLSDSTQPTPGKVSAHEIQQEFQQRLDQALLMVRTDRTPRKSAVFKSEWDKYQRNYSHNPVDTAVPLSVLDDVVRGLFRWPQGFNLNKKITKQLENKQSTYYGKHEGTERGTVDWGMGELLAVGSLLCEGTPVRLSGQDSRRGTFSQRHSVLYDAVDGSTYIPLNFLKSSQEKFCVYNSPLSEAGVLGFDYGYSLEQPAMLIMWEAQFGDFANGAQVIIDQFISSAEFKWQRASGIVLLLPHGQEGMGPEHSSARLERFLQLSAEDNMQVCNLTTPAQYFHALRRQIKRNFRKPLIIMTPKSLLRHPLCVSPVQELASGGFHEVLDDPNPNMRSAERLLLTSGKIFYELWQARDERKRLDTAIIRLEQFYPWPAKQLGEVLSRYPQAQELIWVQEEPQNMGGYSFVATLIKGLSKLNLQYIGRQAAASPAVGSLSLHKREQANIIDQSIGGLSPQQAGATVIKMGGNR